jgi:hypothetical protein
MKIRPGQIWEEMEAYSWLVIDEVEVDHDDEFEYVSMLLFHSKDLTVPTPWTEKIPVSYFKLPHWKKIA